VGFPFTTTLARNEAAAVAVLGADLYPSGMTFRLMVVMRDETDALLHGDMLAVRPRGSSEADPDPHAHLRLSIRFPDGSVSMDRFADLRDLAREPGFDTRPLLSEMGGGGNGRRWDTEYFLSPLPPDGLMDVRCEWPGYIPETHAIIDVTGLQLASTGAVELWPEERV